MNLRFPFPAAVAPLGKMIRSLHQCAKDVESKDVVSVSTALASVWVAERSYILRTG